MVKNTEKIWWHLHCKDFISVYDHFATLRRKTLSYNFQEFFKGIITIILFFIYSFSTMSKKHNTNVIVLTN